MMNLAQLTRYYELKLQGKEEVIQTTPNIAKETLKALYELYDYCIDDPTLDEINMESVKEYDETKDGKADDKTLRRVRLSLNSKYGVMSAKEWYEKED